MNRLFIILLALLLAGCQTAKYIAYCATPGRDWETGEVHKKIPDGIPFGYSLYEVKQGWTAEKPTYIVLDKLPNPSFKGDVDNSLKSRTKWHYQCTVVTSPKGRKFTLIHTYDDDEDGGNSYGWVEEKGQRVAWIHDCNIQKEP